MSLNTEKQQALVTSLTNIGALVGTNSIGISNGIKGLNLQAEESKCFSEAKAVRDGLFKVALMGSFTCGKSTVINALIGTKILPESVLPCTATLTFVQYGQDEDNVDVFMADQIMPDGSIKKGECKKMSIREFQEEYRYTYADEVEFKTNGTISRFTNVKYAIMRTTKPLMEGGVSIIDAPGLEDKVVATELALDIAQKSQAIIYVLQEKGLTLLDKEYIRNNFRNCPNNIFFLINKFDLVPEAERPQVLAKVKLELADIFERTDGKIDDSLMNRRIFGISALRALDSRRGYTYDRDFEAEVELDSTKRNILLEKSGFIPFEQELEVFLTTDERCVAQYRNCFAKMASAYKNSELQINEYIRAYEGNILIDEAKKKECEDIISQINASINTTNQTFNYCSLKIQNAVGDLLNGCINNIDSTWDQDIEELTQKVDVSTLSYMLQGLKQLNPFASKKQKEENIKKFTGKFIDVVAIYFSDRITDYIKENSVIVDNVIDECQQKLNQTITDTDQLFSDLAQQMTSGDDVSFATNNQNWLQVTMSGYLMDFSAMIKGGVEGKTPWLEYLKKTLINSIWQYMLMSLVDGGLGVILVILIEYMQGKQNKSKVIKDILDKSKDGIVKGIRQRCDELKHTMQHQIATDMNNQKEEKCSDARNRLIDEQNKLMEIEQFYNNHNTDLESEKERFDTILKEIYNEAQKAYSVVFNQPLTLEQFQRL